jgi:uncharacterized protein YndB with AHSA1/START domain
MPHDSRGAIPHDDGMDFALSATTVIDATPARIFEVITDVDRLSSWNVEIAKIVEPCAALEVGREWVVEIRAMHTHWNSRSRIVDIDAERNHFAYRSQSDDGNPSYADWQWDVLDDPAGTRVHVMVEGHPQTFWRKHLLSKIRPPGLQRAMNQSLRTLGEQLASHPTTKEEQR